MRQQSRKDQHFQQNMQAQLQHQQMVGQQMKAASGMGKRVLIFVAVFLILIFGFVAYMVTKSMKEAQKMQEEMMEQFH